MKITFETPKEIVIVQELKKTFEEVTIEEVTDSPFRKEVKAFTRELGILVLWSGEAYDLAGQWTDADVVARVTELLK